MTIFIKLAFFLSILPLTVLASTNLNSDAYQSGKDKIVLTVATTEGGYFPYYYEENGEIKGFSVDVLDYVEANSAYEFEFIILPWPRALYLVTQGKIDLILTLFKTLKREQIYHFVEPAYGSEVNQLFALIDSEFKYSGKLQQLTPYSIGTIREYSYGEAFDQARYLNKLPALTEEVLLKLLVSKRIELAIANPLIFNQIILNNNLSSKVKALAPYVALTPVHMALTKSREDSLEIKQTLEKLTLQLRSSSYYQELLDKYQLNFK